ncbi:portal capsid protein Q (GpQ) [Escherichia coli]|uniref:Portal capsid protein Q (GpQ) n=1 Tax=Escherichia coli TaxID=562 RepID=A0A376RAE6_ECOLX|nr:portal capsid protein Q (GpQ) [Escherichia coli]
MVRLKTCSFMRPTGAKRGCKFLPFQQITAKDEFMNVKAASRDDVLAAHRVPPQLMGAMPGEKSAFGDVERQRGFTQLTS